MFIKILGCFLFAVAVSTVLANTPPTTNPNNGLNPGYNNYWNPPAAWTNWFYGWSPFGAWNNWQSPKNPKWVQDTGSQNPWYSPSWHPCSSCYNCTARSLCSRSGLIQQNCSDPNRPFCYFGECSPIPQPSCLYRA